MAAEQPAAESAQTEPGSTDTASLIDTSALEGMLAEMDQQYADYLEGFSLRAVWHELRTNGNPPSLDQLVALFASLFFQEVLASGALLAQIMALSLLALLLQILRGSFASGQIAQLSSWVDFLLLLALMTATFSAALQEARSALQMIADLIFVLLPLLLPLLAALGGVSTVALISPALLFALNLLITLMKNIVFPLICFSALLRLAGRLSPHFPISRMAALCKDAALGLMSIVATLFITFLSLSGIASASRDGLAIKAAKTASGAFIPVVGRTLADSLDSVLGTVLLLKQAIGIIGSLGLLLICALPAIRLLAQAILFRIAGALIQPLGDDALSAALTDAGNALTLLFAALALCGLFAFFALALVVGLGSITMMMR